MGLNILKIAAVPLIVLASAVVAPADNIRWLSTEYDFGAFKEAAGNQQGQVQFVNEGDEPTIITRVNPTCGCTVARYTEGEIAPGDTATVWFEYNSTGRPGRFRKHIKVYTGVASDLTSIVITGTVIGTPSTLGTQYPEEFGPLRLSTSHIRLGNVVYGQCRHEYIYGYNQGTDTLRVSWSHPYDALSLGVSTRNVAPGDLFTLSAYFNSRDQGEIGSLEYPVTLHIDYGERHEDVMLSMSANILPDTSKMNEQQLRDAPSSLVYPTVVELGDISRRSKPYEFSFSVKNEGRTPLKVKRVHSTQVRKALKVSRMPSVVKPGREERVKCKFDTGGLESGPFNVSVEVVTDDPLHPTRILHLIGIAK